MHQKSESKSRNRVSARAKLEVSNVFYAYFILKQKNVKYGVFYYFSAVSFNYAVDYSMRGQISENLQLNSHRDTSVKPITDIVS